MAETKEKKPPRITLACNVCRSRKQKCSGEKPVCRQCLEHNRRCNWPEQLRRGPTKGYMEALEHRLQVTENVLWKLLSCISDTELSSLFSKDLVCKGDNRPAYVPVARLEKKGVEDWSQFPLDSARNIRKWQHACADQEIRPSAGQSTEPDYSCITPLEQRGLERKIPEDFENQICVHGPNSPVSGLSEAHPEEPPGVRSSWGGAPSLSFQEQFLW